MKKSILTSVFMLSVVVAFAQQPVITFEKNEHDFGKINEGDGRVSTEFVFKNEGMEPLVLNNVRASCGCTTPSWTKEPIEPGQTGSITVTYNPNGRPGHFQKTVTITSNASNPTVKVYIKGEVIPKPAQPVNKYPVTIGDLSMSAKSVDFGTVTNGEVTRTIEYANLTDHEITVDVLLNTKDAAYMKALPSFTTLQPKQSGTLTLIFNGATCTTWGPLARSVYMVVNGNEARTEENQIVLHAQHDEDFSALSVDERQKAPIFEINSNELNVGVVKVGGNTQKKFSFKNVGVNPLLIRAIINNNPDLFTITAEKTTIKGGKQGALKIQVAASDTTKPGVYRRQIEVITNDPKNPKIKLQIVWTVE
ncbi:MAG: DUF1573 domain-containing protein [Paludibacteraceae bacterium]|nr:DUF1573 domain-containing protein [Paludibacteraceae bacterium]